KARENLEKSVDLARGSDHSETIRALLTLGYHLEVSEADYEGAGRAYAEAVKLAERTGDLPSLVELHSALALLAAYRADWEAAAREARGATASDPGDAATLLEAARERWLDIGRPLEAARCDLLTAGVLSETDPDAARAAAGRSADDYERLGVAHMAAKARAF